MKGISTEEVKMMQLQILIDVSTFCDKKGLRYYLCGGTMLGAVRHQGFIPWDDDIDIQMPRPDYNRFIHEYQHENYEVCCWDLDKDCLCTYAKVADQRTILFENVEIGKEIGVNIDVFPIDGLPFGERKIRNAVWRMKVLWGIVVCATIKDISKRTRIKKFEIMVMKAFFKMFPMQSYFTGLAIRVAQKYPFDNSDKVATLVWGYGEREVISYSTATEYIKTDFEGYLFNIPKNYKEYLESVYDDYMKLPPENERIYKHQANVIWK